MAAKKVLEWKFESINTANATVTNARIALDLANNELAEIHKVMSSIQPGGFAAGGADDIIAMTMALSTDPNVINDPAVAANNDDAEWFYLHRHQLQAELTTEGASQHKHNDEKSVDFNPPILVGTDVGLVVHNDATITCDSWVRVFFTRRKATANELTQILLKRR